MRPFRELGRRGRLRRFRALASAALASYGLEDARLQFVQYGENVIYRVDAPMPVTTDHPVYFPNRYVLRIHGMDDAEATASELAWLAALNQEAGLPVPAPVTASDGWLVVRIATPGIPHGRVVSLLRWLDGKKIQKGLRPGQLTALGEAVARLHAFSAAWRLPDGFTRPTWDWEAQLGGSLFEHSREELVESMPVAFREPFEIVSAQARQAMAVLGQGADAFGLIHADLYPENVLYQSGRALPIDFEDCGFGYWMWDIAVALCTWAWGSDWVPMRDAFRAGYERFHSLPEVQWALLDLFVATQFATMVLWASAFLKHDPLRVAEYEPWRDKNGSRLLGYLKL